MINLPMLPTPPMGGAPGTGPAYQEGKFELCPETGNYWVVIPGEGEDILWTSHLDTVGTTPETVTLKYKGDMLGTDGSTILGADDKVGVAIMIMMIRAGVPGTYAFYTGEESGCVGSRAAAKEYALRLQGKRGSVTHGFPSDTGFRACISLDRKGTDSVITHQMGERCCGEDWATELAKRISRYMCNDTEYKTDSGGVYTDSASYTEHIDQCTNLSVGYYAQHGTQECVDMKHAYALALALINLGRAEGIPDIKRDRTAEKSAEEDRWMYGYGGGGWWNNYKYHGGAKRRYYKAKRKSPDAATLSERIDILDARIDELCIEHDEEECATTQEEIMHTICSLNEELLQLQEEKRKQDIEDDDDDDFTPRYDSDKYKFI